MPLSTSCLRILHADTQREQPKKQLKPFIVTPPRTGKVDGLLDKTVRRCVPNTGLLALPQA